MAIFEYSIIPLTPRTLVEDYDKAIKVYSIKDLVGPLWSTKRWGDDDTDGGMNNASPWRKALATKRLLESLENGTLNCDVIKQWQIITKVFVKRFTTIIIPQCELFHAVSIIERVFARSLEKKRAKYLAAQKRMSAKARHQVDYQIIQRNEYYYKITLNKPGIMVPATMMFANEETKKHIMILNIQRWIRNVYLAKIAGHLILAAYKLKNWVLSALSWSSIASYAEIPFIKKYAILWKKRTATIKSRRIADAKKKKTAETAHKNAILTKAIAIANKLMTIPPIVICAALQRAGYAIKESLRSRIASEVLQKYILKKKEYQSKVYYASHRMCILSDYFLEILADSIEKSAATIEKIRADTPNSIIMSKKNLLGITYHSLVCFNTSLTAIKDCIAEPVKIMEELESLKKHFMYQICTVINILVDRKTIDDAPKTILEINRMYFSTVSCLHYVYARIINDMDLLYKSHDVYKIIFKYMQNNRLSYTYDNFAKVCDILKRPKAKVSYNDHYYSTCVSNLCVEYKRSERNECKEIDISIASLIGGPAFPQTPLAKSQV
jgi:hypothetical protein